MILERLSTGIILMTEKLDPVLCDLALHFGWFFMGGFSTVC